MRSHDNNIDPALIESASTPVTTAYLVVQPIGILCDVLCFVPIARRDGLPLIEDAAFALAIPA